MIAFEFDKGSDAHILFLDAAGIERLMSVLAEIKGKPDWHIHFMTPAKVASLGGPADELGDKPRSGNTLLDHLIIYSTG